MGYFWQGLPPYLIPWSRKVLPAGSTAVETGTFQGDTSLLLADAFGACTTIERSASLAAAARVRFAGDPRVTILEGSSRTTLTKALPPPEQGCFFWLDAHGMYDYDGEDDDENPLLAEISLILQVRGDSPNVIAVDDARGMGTQPDWPPLTEIFGLLADHRYVGAIVDDALVAAPKSADVDFYALYRASRQVQVPAVFHIWPQVRGLVKARVVSDRVVTSVRDRLRR
ncbi:MAG TPA: hypothetical protein DCQ36_01610 [Actinobacteria bacterium]|nr:hypothetical protein [Actinomycetota bacterium]